MNIAELKKKLVNGDYDKEFNELYSKNTYKERYLQTCDCFSELYGENESNVFMFSAPGRVEIGGNHTDHQNGRVLAAAINLDTIAIAAPTIENTISVKSEGHKATMTDLSMIEKVEEERGSDALIRGMSAYLRKNGYKTGGFKAYTETQVLKGSGLSSSAAFEMLIGSILNNLYNDGNIPMLDIARAGQFAENEYFGKPCGLMDQSASALGGFVGIDFKDPQNIEITKVEFDFDSAGYAICIVDTKGNHADMKEEYADITKEMRAIAAHFGKSVLREVNEEDLYSSVKELSAAYGDRAILRAMHFFDDDKNAADETAALQKGNMNEFLRLVNKSGQSSLMKLQNIYSNVNYKSQGVTLALAMSDRVLNGKGAYRVHGSGFAGTIEAFVPKNMLNEYRKELDKVFGEGSCHVLSVRNKGAIQIT